jgi:hypothetical protein
MPRILPGMAVNVDNHLSLVRGRECESPRSLSAGRGHGPLAYDSGPCEDYQCGVLSPGATQ